MDIKIQLAITHLKQAIDLLTPVPAIVETPVTYFANAWTEPPKQLRYVNWMARFGDQAYWGWAVPPAQTLEQCIAALDDMPPGQKWLQSWDYQRPDYGQGEIGFYHDPDDAMKDANGKALPGKTPFSEHAEKMAFAKFSDFFSKLKAANAQLDGLFMDFEDGYTMWGASQVDATNAALDPRFLPTLKKVGTSDMAEIYDFWNHKTYLRYNAVMSAQKDAMLNRAIYKALIQYYPKALCFNDSSWITSEDNWVHDLNGHHAYSRIKEDMAVTYGTHDCYEAYGGGYNPGFANQTVDGEVMGSSRRKSFLHAINEFRAMMRSSNRPVMPIICPKFSWTRPGRSAESLATALGCDLWEEIIFHMAVSGCNSFVYWNPADPYDPNIANPEENINWPDMTFEQQNPLLDQALSQCQTNVPHLGQRLDVSYVPYTSTQVRSTLKCKGYSISRVTTFDKDGYFKGEWIKL